MQMPGGSSASMILLDTNRWMWLEIGGMFGWAAGGGRRGAGAIDIFPGLPGIILYDRDARMVWGDTILIFRTGK